MASALATLSALRFSAVLQVENGGQLLLVAALLTLGMLFYWLLTPAAQLLTQAGVRSSAPLSLGMGLRLSAFLIAMIPLGALIIGLLSARRTFRHLAQVQVFSTKTVCGLKSFAVAVACSALLKPIAEAALSVLSVLLSSQAAGQKSLVLTVGSDRLLSLIFAGTVAVIAWIMAEAVSIADENKQFI